MKHITNSVLKNLIRKKESKVKTTQMCAHKTNVDMLHEGPRNIILWQIIHDGKFFIFTTTLKNGCTWKYISWLEHLNSINKALGSIPSTTRKERETNFPSLGSQ